MGRAGRTSQENFESELAQSRDRGSVAVLKKGNEIGEAVEINVGGVGGAVVRAEAVIYGGGESASVARGLHVDFGIADQDGFGWSGAEFTKNRLRTDRVRLFCFKTVAAVDDAKKVRNGDRVHNAHAEAHRLDRENDHK